MREIALNNGSIALVDDADFDWLSKFNWHQMDGYARAVKPHRKGETKKFFFMHNLILMEEGMKTDHIDGNRLNNQRQNLRACTISQNGMNRGLAWNNKSGFKGVSWHKASRKWCAQLKVMGESKLYKTFDDIQEAAHAYNKAAIQYFGEFAVLNPVGEDYAGN